MKHSKEPLSILWDKLPSAVDPSEGMNSRKSLGVYSCCHAGHLPLDRVQRKRQQIENMLDHVQHLISGGSDVIVDFCAGGVSVLSMFCASWFVLLAQGHLGIAVAYSYPRCQVSEHEYLNVIFLRLQVILVENKEESLLLARERVKLLNLTNVTCVQVCVLIVIYISIFHL